MNESDRHNAKQRELQRLRDKAFAFDLAGNDHGHVLNCLAEVTEVLQRKVPNTLEPAAMHTTAVMKQATQNAPAPETRACRAS